jgi:hypothetical protein
MTGVEALADAIMQFEGWKVGSRSWRNRNPGNLRDAAAKIGEDPEGYAIFHSLIGGWSALCDDIEAKVSGHNTHGLGRASTLVEFFRVYAPAGDANNPASYAAAVAQHCTSALNRPVTVASTLAEICPEVTA